VEFKSSGVMALHEEEGNFIRKNPDDVKETETHIEVSESQASGGKSKNSMLSYRKYSCS